MKSSRRIRRLGRGSHRKVVQHLKMRRPLPTDLLRRIDSDPLFQVMTSDHQSWIDPFTGTPIPAPNGRSATAKEYLLDSGVWKDREPLSRGSIETIRWRLELMRLLPIDPRLRIFGKEHGWVNPYTGEMVEDVAREDGRITLRTIMTMARVLASCPQAQFGRMLDNQTLMQKLQTLGLAHHHRAQTPADTATGLQRAITNDLSDDMTRAKNVQQHMLSDMPQLESLELAVHYAAHAGVSGDFYEVITLKDGRVMMLLGDVSGHGMQAALVVATALKTLRFLARQTSDLVTLLSQFNDEIKGDLIPGQFITMFAALLDPVSHRATCVRAGHHAALLANLDQGTVLRKLGQMGIAIGLVDGVVFKQSLKPEIVGLQPGDVLLQYTDGLTEALDAQEVEFGDARLYGSFLTHLELPMQELVDRIAKDVNQHAKGNLNDDLTIIALAVYDTPGSDEIESNDIEKDISR
jgi:serine phosphatase RsbU (regulator of sigma subunit)